MLLATCEIVATVALHSLYCACHALRLFQCVSLSPNG